MRTETAGIAHLPLRDAARTVSDPLLWPGPQPGGRRPGGPAGELLLVDLDEAAGAPAEIVAAAAARIGASDRVVAGTAAGPLAPDAAGPLLEALTLTVARDAGGDRRIVGHENPAAAAAALAASFAACPSAGTVLRQVLAATARLPVREGLRVESFAYSTLLAGPEFRAWLARRTPPRPAAAGHDPVQVSRDGEILVISLDDPSRRNAYSAAMREGLLDALSVAADPSIREVRIRGRGPAFCSGGDLAEFGTGPGGSIAHFVRTQRSPGLLVHRLRDRVRADLHGACVGAGIELPAFAGWLSARPDTVIRLPEIAMGLIPGAGGTVSITRRIGRWRTAYLALSGLPVGAPTALDWGLVDEIAG
jgi:enoyl-CoA hydratase/carnithine racemase